MLQVISGKESSYAANILNVLIKQHIVLRNELNVEKMRSETDCEKIVNSIKGFVKDKLKTVKRRDKKEDLSAIIQAYTYQQDVNTYCQSICDTIGVQKRTY